MKKKRGKMRRQQLRKTKKRQPRERRRLVQLNKMRNNLEILLKLQSKRKR